MNRRALGIVIAVLGLLITCCLCPLAVNSWVFLATAATSDGRPGSIVSIYGQLFPARMGVLTASSYVSAAQFLCLSGLALAVLMIGVIVLLQARSDRS